MPGKGFIFGGAVAGVWTALGLKKERDDYSAIATDDGEDGRIHLPNSAAPNGENGLNPVRREKKPSGCCVCCGIDCSLFWKAFGAVSALWIVYAIISGAKWVFSPLPSGTENMLAFGSSITCDAQAFFYKDSPQGFPVSVPVTEKLYDHSIKLLGSGIGTLTVTNAPKGATEVSYNIVLHGSDKEAVDATEISIEQPDDEGQGRALRLATRNLRGEENSCIRFDIIMSVPDSVRVLNIHSKSVLQIKFAEDARFNLKKLSIVLFRLDDRNMILSSKNVFAEDINLEVYRGWIVGETTVSKSTHIVTQRGDGVANLKIHPSVPHDFLHPEAATLRTTTGAGQTNIEYIANPTKRPINSIHMSQRKGDVHLDYKQARFDGKIAMSSKGYTITGAKPIDERSPSKDTLLRRDVEDGRWTHIGGTGKGEDRIQITTSGGRAELFI